MDILSFVLGIVVVGIIVLTIVAVTGFVKARNVEQELMHFRSGIVQELERGTTDIHLRVDGLEREVYSQLDSRLDKLENKLLTKK